MAVQISGMSLAAIVGILLNLFIVGEEDEEITEVMSNKDAVEELKNSIKDELTVELKGELLDEIRNEIIKEKKGK